MWRLAQAYLEMLTMMLTSKDGSNARGCISNGLHDAVRNGGGWEVKVL
jgi:hypothetical protein